MKSLLGCLTILYLRVGLVQYYSKKLYHLYHTVQYLMEAALHTYCIIYYSIVLFLTILTAVIGKVYKCHKYNFIKFV